MHPEVLSGSPEKMMVSKFGIGPHFQVNHITLQKTNTSHLGKSLQKCLEKVVLLLMDKIWLTS